MRKYLVLKQFFDYFTQKKFLVVSMFTVMFVLLSISMCVPYLTGNVIDKGIGKNDFDMVLKLSYLIGSFYFLSFIAGYLKNYYSIYLSNDYIYFQKKKFIKKLYNQKYAFVATKRFGALYNLIENDIFTVSSFCQQLMFGLVINLCHFLGLLIFIIYLNYKLAIIGSISLILYMFIIKISGKKIELYSRFLRAEKIKLNSFSFERLRKLFKIKLFNREDVEFELFSEKYDEFLNKFYKINRFNIVINQLKDITGKIGILLLLITGGYLVIKKEITLGMLIAFNGYFAAIFAPAIAVFNIKLDFHRTLVSFRRLKEFLNLEDEIQADENKEEISSINSLKVSNLKFKFEDSDKLLFDEVSFDAMPGKILSIKGANGTGKSTIAFLLTGFYHDGILGGEILYNNESYKGYKRSSIRDRIAYIMQKPQFFSGSISENIEIKDCHVSDLYKDIKKYELTDLIDKKGMDYILDENASNLSGGEKQRLSIIEAVTRKKDVYIFDEPESAQDKENREVVRNLVLKLKKEGKIVILISHSNEFESIIDNIIEL